MDERTEPPTPPAGLPRPPAVRPPVPSHPPEVPSVGRAPWRGAWDADGSGPGDEAGPPPRPIRPDVLRRWRSLRVGAPGWRWGVGSRRIAVGIGIAAAVLFLWAQSQLTWSGVVSWAVGLGALVLMRILRLDRVLIGWGWHLVGLVLLAGLAQGAGAWAVGTALAVGVLLAGAARLPHWWWVAAAGLVLCLVAGTGFAVTEHRSAEQAAAQQLQTQKENKARLGERYRHTVLPRLLDDITEGEGGVGPICENLVAAPALASFAAAAGQPDCPAAVRALAAQVRDGAAYPKAQAPSSDRDEIREVDACHMTWRDTAMPPGPQLGHLTVGRTETGASWVVTAVRPCP